MPRLSADELRDLTFQLGSGTTFSNLQSQVQDSTSSNLQSQVQDTTFSNPSYPKGDCNEIDLLRVAATALNARGKGHRSRKELKLPVLKRGYSKGKSYYGDLWDFYQAWGYKTQNDLQGAGLGQPSFNDLAALFEDHMLKHARTWHSYDGRGVGLNSTTVAAMAERAARASLRDWTPTWIEKQRSWGAQGGAAGRRKSMWLDPANLDRLEALHGKTKAEQAKAFGVKSTSTIDLGRAALKARNL